GSFLLPWSRTPLGSARAFVKASTMSGVDGSAMQPSVAAPAQGEPGGGSFRARGLYYAKMAKRCKIRRKPGCHPGVLARTRFCGNLKRLSARSVAETVAIWQTRLRGQRKRQEGLRLRQRASLPGGVCSVANSLADSAARSPTGTCQSSFEPR